MTLPVADRSDGRIPKYVKIADRIRSQIINGDIKPGENIPSQDQLVKDHRVALTTVRQALSLLQRQGLIEAMQGKGVFVRGSVPMKDEAGLCSIGFLSSGAPVTDPVHYIMLQGIQAENREIGFRLVYGHYYPGQPQENEHLRTWCRGLDGVIVTGLITQELFDYLQENIPHIVIIGGTNVGVKATRTSVITLNTTSTTFLAVNYLATLGHKDLLLVNRSGTEIYELFGVGFKEAVANLQLAGQIEVCPETSQERDFIERFARRRPRPTAMVVNGVQRGYRLVTLLREAGLQVPRDISVVGIGCKELVTELIPRLTCIDEHCNLMGQMAIKALKSSMLSNQLVRQEVVGRIFIGETCAAPNTETAN